MSTTKKLFALSFIFVCATIAWAILGSTIFTRTYGLDDSLKSKVGSSWGTAQVQSPATASYQEVTQQTQEVIDSKGKTATKLVEVKEEIPVPLDSTSVQVGLNLEHRQKGLLWYSTYKAAFSGEYAFNNSSGKDQYFTFKFPLPAEQAMYDNVVFMADGEPLQFQNSGNALESTRLVEAGKTAVLKVAYASQGMDRWTYKFSDQVAHIRDFHLSMSTNFNDIDFPENTLSPSEKHETSGGWKLDWNYQDLLSGYQIGMTMPEKLQPGPLAGRISFFAPVSLFFFFFLVFIITTMRGVNLHPMNYFFLAAAFFAFHLLMAYLVDHISIHAAFFISAAVSLALVISYMRLVTGPRFALVDCGIAQFIYLVLFSYAFFFKGFTGLAVTVGSIVTLFLVMQMTGRINWSERFARTSSGSPTPVPPPPLAR